MGCTSGIVMSCSHCLMMDIFSYVSKVLGLLESEEASKTLPRKNSNSMTLDTGHHKLKIV
jgi:hypothetical protein